MRGGKGSGKMHWSDNQKSTSGNSMWSAATPLNLVVFYCVFILEQQPGKKFKQTDIGQQLIHIAVAVKNDLFWCQVAMEKLVTPCSSRMNLP